MSTIAANFAEMRQQIDQIAHSCGREPSEIELVAVSKTFPPETVRSAHQCGHRVFGENRVQEAEGKIAALEGLDLEWHLIGHLQSNKARRAVELFDVIQSLDGKKIIQRVGHQARTANKRLRVYLQINIGSETQKFGVGESEAPHLVELIDSQSHLQLMGLMAIPPWSEDPEESRPYFRRMRRLLEQLNLGRSRPLTGLSMGMSHDYPVAIQEGATVVRVGTALFGPRSSP